MNFLSKLLGFNAARGTQAQKPGQNFNSSFLWQQAVAGVHVDEFSAMRYAPVWRAVNVIAQTIAALPWLVFEPEGGKLIERQDHPVHRLLNVRPNSEMTPFVFRESMIHHALTWGNGYAEIERMRSGEVANLWPVTPDRVRTDRDSKGNIVYLVNNSSSGGTVTLAARSIYHLKGPGFDGLSGYSLVRLASESISLGLALQQFGSAFFGNGAQPGGFLEVDGSLSDPARENLLKSFKKMHGGSKNAHKLAILEEGLKYKERGVAPDQAQFIDSRDFEVSEASRWFGVPPHKLGKLSESTFSNIENQNREFAQESIVPWAVRLQQEADIKLFSDDGPAGFETRMDLKKLMRGDTKSRTQANKDKFTHGVLTINEWRAEEDMNDIGDAGELRLVPMNMTSVEKAITDGNTGQKGRKEGQENDKSDA